MTVIRPHLISATIDGVDVSDAITRFEVHANPAADEVVTFASARTGGEHDWTAQMTILEDHASGSLLTMAIETPGTEVDVVYEPDTTAAGPSAAIPHYEGVLIPQVPAGKVMGGTATRSRNTYSTVEVIWPFKAKPTKVTA